jgi:hypothetical protein
MSIVKGKNIDVSQINISQPKVLDNGAKLVYVNYGGGRFNIQTPWMEVPWDLSCYDEGPFPKYSCEISFKGMDDDAALKTFHDKMLEVEERLVEAGVENGTSWFKMPKNKINTEIISSKFGHIVKVSKDKATGEPDGKYAPTMRLKVACRDNVWKTKLQAKDGDAFNINGDSPETPIQNIIVKNAKMKCIMSCVGLWIASGNYMCQWELTRAEVDVPESAGGGEFLPDSDDEDETSVSVSSAPTMLDDTDDDDEEEGEAAVAPKKKIVKKKVVKN